MPEWPAPRPPGARATLLGLPPVPSVRVRECTAVSHAAWSVQVTLPRGRKSPLPLSSLQTEPSAGC